MVRFKLLACVLVLALVSSMPARAQTLEPAARKAAAFTDYRKSCAAEISSFRSTQTNNNDTGDYSFQASRAFESTQILRTLTEMQNFYSGAQRSVASGGLTNPSRHLMWCAIQVAMRHALHGVPGYDHGASGGASAPAPSPKAAPKPGIAEKLPPAQPAQTVSRKSEADAKYAAELREYQRKLAAQQKAVADYKAAQRQMAADKAAAAARAKAAQEDFARQQAAYQAEQDRYASERAEYEAELSGQSGTSEPGESSVPPLRPTALLEAHNPANEASHCVKGIAKPDFEANRVSSTAGAVIRNICTFDVEAKWCIGTRCSRGYDNTFTVKEESYRDFSFDSKVDNIEDMELVGCRMGFVYRSDFAGTLQYACK